MVGDDTVKNPWAWIAVAAVVVGVFVLGLSLGTRRSDSEGPAHNPPRQPEPSQTPRESVVEPQPPVAQQPPATKEMTVSDFLGQLKEKLYKDSGMVPDAELEGSGSQQTNYFNVSTDDQFFCWVQPTPTIPVLMVTVRAAGSNRLVDTVSPEAKPGGGSFQLRLPRGSYYLEVTGSGPWGFLVYPGPGHR